MGVIFSCCNRNGSNETDPLLQGAQNGYNSSADNDYDAVQRQLEQEEQKLLAREQELTEIVNNTNDKLIDISMMSNSGIVVQSNDLDGLLDSDGREQDSNAATIKAEGNKLRILDPSKIKTSERIAVKKLSSMLFERLNSQLHIEPVQNLIVTL